MIREVSLVITIRHTNSRRKFNPTSSSKVKQPIEQNPSSPYPSPSRIWRPAAQKNIRNQWSNILISKNHYVSASYEARSHATSLVNSHLSQMYMPDMDLGCLKNMPCIREKACTKLAIKQKICRKKLLSSYKDMVVAVAQMVQSSCLLRCFLKVSTNSSLVQFCDHQKDVNDLGDGGGIPVFSFFSVTNFEDLAQELVGMFQLELNLKRLLVVELLSIYAMEEDKQSNTISWFNEVYPGEFDDLKRTNMISADNNQPLPPQIKNWHSADSLADQYNHTKSSDVLQVYLTTWIADVNIDVNRMNEIVSIVEDEIQVKLS